jgi:hypothetical protein
MLTSVAPSTSNIDGRLRCRRHLGLACQSQIPPHPWPTLHGETWRRLKVTFPDDIASYTREQTSYFGPDGFASSSRLRCGRARWRDGRSIHRRLSRARRIFMPHRRRVYPRSSDNRKLSEPLLVSIDIRDLNFHARVQSQNIYSPRVPSLMKPTPTPRISSLPRRSSRQLRNSRND